MIKKHFYLILIPIIIYILFAIPSLKELASADSVPFLITADEISGTHQWPVFPPLNRAGLWHPHLYVIMLTIIRKILGPNIVFFRLFNLACGVISILYIYLISSNIYKNKKDHDIPLLAALLYSINPLVIKGSLHIDIDNTILTTLMLIFILLFLKNKDHLNVKPIIQLSLVFALLLSAKLTTPPILALATLFYLLINKKNKESLLMLMVFISGFAFFCFFWISYCFKFNYPPLIIFQNLTKYASGFKHTVISPFLYDIFRTILWFSPFFLLLWLTKVIENIFAKLRYKTSVDGKELLTIISLIIFLFYLFAYPSNHAFPKYLFPVISFMCILVADIIAEVKQDMLHGIKTFIVIVGLVIICNIIFVGDLMYLANYTIKDKFIRSGFDILVLHKELFNLLLRLLSLAGLTLFIFIFYRKKEKLKFASAGIITLFIMFLSCSLALDIIQYRAKYQLTYTYGKEGAQDVVRFLKTTISSDSRIIAPYEVVYYLDADKAGFVVGHEMMTPPEKFIGVLKDIDPVCVVYGIASNTIKQYRETFSSELLLGYFRDHHFVSKNIGSYTLWLRADKKELNNPG